MYPCSLGSHGRKGKQPVVRIAMAADTVLQGDALRGSPSSPPYVLSSILSLSCFLPSGHCFNRWCIAASGARRLSCTWRGKMAHIAGLSMCCWTMSCITSGMHCSGVSPGLPKACSQGDAQCQHTAFTCNAARNAGCRMCKDGLLHEGSHIVVEALPPVWIFLVPGPRGRGVMAGGGCHTHVRVVCRVAKLRVRLRGHPLYAQACRPGRMLCTLCRTSRELYLYVLATPSGKGACSSATQSSAHPSGEEQHCHGAETGPADRI